MTGLSFESPVCFYLYLMQPIADGKYKLEKFDGKGGWTFTRIPGIKQDKKAPFGWRKVMGTIDGYPIHKYHLMPEKGGGLFLPVKSEIRKKIGKQAGDWVHVILYPDTEPLEVPGEFLLCLEDEPSALKFFNSLSEGERKYYVQWIYAAKKEDTKATRMAKAINKLAIGLKMYDREN